MIDAPLALAFTAGLVATVNPCGFAMLPAYLGYFMGVSGEGSDDGRGSAIGRGLVVGGVVSSGFLVVFGLAGVLITLGLRSVIGVLPWAAIVIGVGVGLLGIAMIAGYEPVVRLAGRSHGQDGRGYRALFGFGLSYAVASLSCTLPVFLAVVAGAIPQTSLAGGVALFLVYGVGMSLVLVVVTLALALGHQRLVRWLRRATAHVQRVSGAILLLAGAYIVWFWTTSLSNPLAPRGPVSSVETLSSRLTELIGSSPVLWGASFGTIVVVAVLYSVRTRRRST